jgi:hypothetical protein
VDESGQFNVCTRLFQRIRPTGYGDDAVKLRLNFWIECFLWD